LLSFFLLSFSRVIALLVSEKRCYLEAKDLNFWRILAAPSRSAIAIDVLL